MRHPGLNLPFFIERLVKPLRAKKKKREETRKSIYAKYFEKGPSRKISYSPGYVSTQVNLAEFQYHRSTQAKLKRSIETLPRRGYLDHDCDSGHCSDNPLYGLSSPRITRLGE